MRDCAADVIIPIHGRPDLLHACLTSLERGNDGVIGTVYVVDDASPLDDARRAQAVCAGRHFPVEWIAINSRSGFVAAANAGWNASTRPITVILNNDTVLAPGTIGVIHEMLERDPQLAATAPASDNPRDLFQYRARPGRRGTTSADYLTAMCLAVRRSAVGTLLFDTAYSPGYFEDLDLSCRLRTSGWQLSIGEEAIVHHLGAATFGAADDWPSPCVHNYGTFMARWGWLPSRAALDEALQAAGALAGVSR